MGPGMPSWQPAAYGIPVGTVCHWISQVGVVTTGVGGRGRQHFYQRNLHHNLWFQNSLFGIACNNYSSYGLHLNYVKLQLCVTINMINIGIHDLQVYSPFGTLQPKDRQLTPGWSHSTLKKGMMSPDGAGIENFPKWDCLYTIILNWYDPWHVHVYNLIHIYIYIYIISEVVVVRILKNTPRTDLTERLFRYSIRLTIDGNSTSFPDVSVNIL